MHLVGAKVIAVSLDCCERWPLTLALWAFSHRVTFLVVLLAVISVARLGFWHQPYYIQV
jgi:hypothetical protein